jgi:hypothetical protein
MARKDNYRKRAARSGLHPEPGRLLRRHACSASRKNGLLSWTPRNGRGLTSRPAGLSHVTTATAQASTSRAVRGQCPLGERTAGPAIVSWHSPKALPISKPHGSAGPG